MLCNCAGVRCVVQELRDVTFLFDFGKVGPMTSRLEQESLKWPVSLHFPYVTICSMCDVVVAFGLASQVVASGAFAWMAASLNELRYSRVLTFVQRVVEGHPMLRGEGFKLLQTAFLNTTDVRDCFRIPSTVAYAVPRSLCCSHLQDYISSSQAEFRIGSVSLMVEWMLQGCVSPCCRLLCCRPQWLYAVSLCVLPGTCFRCSSSCSTATPTQTFCWTHK